LNKLVGVDLRSQIPHKIHHDGFIATSQEKSAEHRLCLHSLERSVQFPSNGSKSSRPLLQQVVGREEIEILGLAVLEVKPCEGSPAGQKEPLIAPEERFQHLLLKSIQRHRRREALASTRQRVDTPRTPVGDPSV